MAAHHLLGVCLEFAGDMTEASRILDRGRELHDPEQHRAYTATFGLDPGMIARAMSSRPLWVLGYPDRAEARARETLQLARSQRQPMTLVFALLVTQGVHLVRGEASEALTIGDEVVALCNEFGLPQEREWSRWFSRARRSPRSAVSTKASTSSAIVSRSSARSAPAWCAARSLPCSRICCASPAERTRR